MAERALLACEQADGRYTVATSRWGGTDSALATVCLGVSPQRLADVDWTATQCFPEFTAVVATLDVLTVESLYRVTSESTTAFVSLWFGLPLVGATGAHPGVGALAAVDSVADARALRRWFRSVKGTLTDAVTTGALPIATAPLALTAAVASRGGRERYLVSAGTAVHLSPGTGPDDL